MQFKIYILGGIHPMSKKRDSSSTSQQDKTNNSGTKNNKNTHRKG